MLVIIVSVTFYAVVDFHASRIMKSIKTLIAEEATVIRNGQQQTISASDIVVGDLVVLTMVYTEFCSIAIPVIHTILGKSRSSRLSYRSGLN
jgi:magnesium-transporting ATPase (P-type)